MKMLMTSLAQLKPGNDQTEKVNHYETANDLTEQGNALFDLAFF